MGSNFYFKGLWCPYQKCRCGAACSLSGEWCTNMFDYPFPIFARWGFKDLVLMVRNKFPVCYFWCRRGSGGSVTFDNPPVDGVVVTLERRMTFERLTDFVEGVIFAASAINAEMDFLVAGLQQVSRDQISMLRFDGRNSIVCHFAITVCEGRAGPWIWRKWWSGCCFPCGKYGVAWLCSSGEWFRYAQRMINFQTLFRSKDFRGGWWWFDGW